MTDDEKSAEVSKLVPELMAKAMGVEMDKMAVMTAEEVQIGVVALMHAAATMHVKLLKEDVDTYSNIAAFAFKSAVDNPRDFITHLERVIGSSEPGNA